LILKDLFSCFLRAASGCAADAAPTELAGIMRRLAINIALLRSEESCIRFILPTNLEGQSVNRIKQCESH
jgi:hypothetical protein